MVFLVGFFGWNEKFEKEKERECENYQVGKCGI